MVAASVAVGPSIGERWHCAAKLVAETRDVLDARPGDTAAGPPDAIVVRGWATFLLSLDDGELAALEIGGHRASLPARAPATLHALVAQVRDVCALPSFSSSNLAPSRLRLGQTPRKREQIDAFAHLITPLASRAARVVDVGSGHGHLTREIAERIAAPVVGLERDPAIADRARALSTSARRPSFAVTDVLRDGLALREGDCVIGLHACGELGDRMAASVARAADMATRPRATLALVGCCLQKRRQTSRRPLHTPGSFSADALDLPRALLGLSNLAATDQGVEATRAQNLVARQRRLALNRLLGEGAPLRLGAEIEGLNRRAAHRSLAELVALAYAVRGRPLPSESCLDEAAAWARVEHARARRLSVARSLLARVLEVYVLLDRAAHLESRGMCVEIGELFPVSASPRNLALVAT